MLAPRSWLRHAGACVCAVTSIAVVAFAQQAPAPPPPGRAAPPTPIAAVLRSYQPVTAERLKKPEPGNWLMIRGTYDGWGYSPLDRSRRRTSKRLRPVWGFSTGEARVHESAPVVNNGVMFVSTPNNQVIAIDAKSGNVLWRYRRPRPAGAIVAHRYQPRRRALRRQGVLSPRVKPCSPRSMQDRQGSLDHDRRRQQVELLHLARAAGRRRQGDGRRLGRGIRHPRLRRGVRSGHRQGVVADLYDSGAGRAGQRDVAEGRSMEDRRRAGVGDRELRSRHQPRVLGNRQRRPVDRRSASRRQPLRRVDDCDRCRDRPDQGPLPIQPERIVGLGRGVAADPGRLSTQRPHHQRADRRGARWLSLVSRAHQRHDQFRRRQAVREAERVPAPRPGDRTARCGSGAQAGNRQAG